MVHLRTIFLLLLSASVVIYGCGSDEEKKLAHLEKGKEYFEKGEYKSAQIEFKNAIQIDPRFTEAYSQLAETNFRLGDARGAIQAYFKVAELDPDDLDAQLKLSTFYLLGKKYDEAREKIDGILAKDPNNTEALILLGGILSQENNLFEAASVFEKVIELDSTESDCAIHRTWDQQSREFYDLHHDCGVLAVRRVLKKRFPSATSPLMRPGALDSTRIPVAWYTKAVYDTYELQGSFFSKEIILGRRRLEDSVCNKNHDVARPQRDGATHVKVRVGLHGEGSGCAWQRGFHLAVTVDHEAGRMSGAHIRQHPRVRIETNERCRDEITCFCLLV